MKNLRIYDRDSKFQVHHGITTRNLLAEKSARNNIFTEA